MDSGALYSALLFAGELVVPLVLAASFPRRLAIPIIAVSGVALFGVVWFLGYQASLVDNGGDWTPGIETAMFTFTVNLTYFIPLWGGGTILGLIIRRRLAGGRPKP